jgi:hypothetical protein
MQQFVLSYFIENEKYPNLALIKARNCFEKMEGPDVPHLRVADDLEAVGMEDAVQVRIQFVQFSVKKKSLLIIKLIEQVELVRERERKREKEKQSVSGQ